MDEFMQAAIDEAKMGLEEGGIPIGSVLVHKGKIIGRGHNRRVQKGSVVLHAEMDALEKMIRNRLKVISFSSHRFVIHKGFVDQVFRVDPNLPKEISFAFWRIIRVGC